MVAHLVVVAYPVLASSTLASRLTALGRTLPREQSLWRARLVAYWVLSCGVTFVSLTTTNLSRYDRAHLWAWTMVMGAGCAAMVRRWPQAGLLVGASAAVTWLVVGDSIAALMGFPLFPMGTDGGRADPRFHACCWLVVLAVLVTLWRWRRDPEPGS